MSSYQPECPCNPSLFADSWQATCAACMLRPALAQVLPDIDQAGIADMDELSTAIQVVFIQLAVSADILVDLEQSDPERLLQLVEGGM